MGGQLSLSDGDLVGATGSVSEVPMVSGTHDFTIREYSRAKGKGVGKSILSQYFTVDDRTWYIGFYPDGYSAADDKWIAFFVQTLYKPQFRDVRAEFSFQLLRANGDAVYKRRSDRACKYDTFCNSWGIRRFITREQLEGAALGALDNDSLTVRCTVRVHKERISRADSRPGPVAVPPSCHASNAMRFLASGKAPFDVRFSVDGVVFEAHRLVVACQSPWFEGLLYGHGREAGSDLVHINGTSPEAFRGVLHYIYHDELPHEAIKGRDAYAATTRLFAAADMFLLERMKMMCASGLCNFISESTVQGIMELAEAHSCKELEQACRNFSDRRGLSLLPISAPATATSS